MDDANTKTGPMIDITIHPSQTSEAQKAIVRMIQDYNRYNRFDTIEFRCPYDGKFMSVYDHMWVIDNTDRTDGEYFIRVEFDDDYKIQQDVIDYFGEFNVGYC